MREVARALLALVVCAGPAAAAPLDALLGGPEMLDPQQAFRIRLAGAGERAAIELDIAPGYYVYKNKLRARSQDGAVLALVLPPGAVVRDEAFGEVEVYRGAIAIGAPVPPGTRTIEVEYQGCAERRLCYPPARRVLAVDGA